MKLIQRVGYYLGGFSMGLVILAVVLNGKHVSCSYGPEARVLKDIGSKRVIFSPVVQSALQENKIDSTTINQILKNGSINFSDSQARHKPCGIYAIENKDEKKPIVLTVENCDTLATITNIHIK
jgi:hypothetical protein